MLHTNHLTSTIVIGLINMLTTILAIKYVDKFWRKPILYFGLSLVITSCIVVSFIFKTYFVYDQLMVLSQTLQWTALIFCLLFTFGFAIPCIVCILFVKFFVPETKDVSLEEIETTSSLANL
ncbi:hypothetical protein FSC845_05135 [Francisella persica ATCC VR-331]|nr:hypothetical protein FSC845_05135 [Francisella persica ATCC VR-331]